MKKLAFQKTPEFLVVLFGLTCYEGRAFFPFGRPTVRLSNFFAFALQRGDILRNWRKPCM